MSKTSQTKLLVDIVTFTAFLILMNPRSSGIAVHEWLAIALSGAVMVHLLFNWSWIAEMTKRVFTKGLNGSRWNYILNWLLFIDGILVMLSGLMISQSVMPTLGFNLPVGFTWRGIHETSTNVVMIILGLHVAMHWNWIVTTFKRIVGISSSPVTQPKIVMQNNAIQMQTRKDAQA